MCVWRSSVCSAELTARGRADGIVCLHDGAERTVRADLVVLGANAIFNPAILLRSGLSHPLLGRRLHEQVGVVAEVHLDGVDSFQGSSSVTGHGYMLYADDARRRETAACLLQSEERREGQRVSVPVDLGGRRVNKKKK